MPFLKQRVNAPENQWKKQVFIFSPFETAHKTAYFQLSNHQNSCDIPLYW